MDTIVNKFVTGGVLLKLPFEITHKDNTSIMYYKRVAYIVLNFNKQKLSVRPSTTPPREVMKVMNKILNRLGQEILEPREGNLFPAYSSEPINPMNWTDYNL